MKLMMFVLDVPEKLDELVLAWQVESIDVISIIESTTLCQQTPFHLGARFGFAVPQRGPCEIAHVTLMAVLANDEALALAAEIAENVLGSLDDPETGILMAWELSDVRGLGKLPSNHAASGADA